MTYICAPIFVTLPTDNGVTVEFNPSLAPVVPIPSGPQGIPGPQGPQGPQGPAGGVSSVNGKTGDVELDAEDVGALPDTTPLFSGDYEDLTNKPTIPAKVSDLTNDSGFVNASQAAAAAPVQSVNGQTGAVSVPVPTKVSDLTNDSGFVDANGAAAAAPVQSVNGQTGAVIVPEFVTQEITLNTSDWTNNQTKCFVIGKYVFAPFYVQGTPSNNKTIATCLPVPKLIGGSSPITSAGSSPSVISIGTSGTMYISSAGTGTFIGGVFCYETE